MKRLFYFVPTIIFLAIFVMTACQNSTEEIPSSQLLVVERQHMVVRNPPFAPFGKICFTMDIPFSGPKVLKDSVVSFLNEQLYKYFNELADSFGITPDSLNKYDTGQLLRHYVDAYQPLLQERFGWIPSLCITMLAQTESFVTYGVSFYRYKSIYESEMYCYTFSKQDGHILRDVISDENLDKFFDEHKARKKSEFEWEYDSTMEINQEFFGLLEDSLLFVVNNINHLTVLARYGYSEILPYLSEESRLLISQKGNHDSFLRSEWYVGWQIGTVTTEEGDTIILMEKDMAIELPPIELERGAMMVMTCTRKNGLYVPILGFKTTDGTKSSIVFDIPVGDWYSPEEDKVYVISNSYDSYDCYDADKRELKMICSKGTDEAVIRTYKFDGYQFVYTNKDVELSRGIVD